ncbi:MAG: SPOR domain-containing protein [Magnetococcales bacterium]|nr:SPOR domain-containing protein [Magnetococcales bacterium]
MERLAPVISGNEPIFTEEAEEDEEPREDRSGLDNRWIRISTGLAGWATLCLAVLWVGLQTAPLPGWLYSGNGKSAAPQLGSLLPVSPPAVAPGVGPETMPLPSAPPTFAEETHRTAEPTPREGGPFVVVAGSFTALEAAEQVHARLTAEGIAAVRRDALVDGQPKAHVLVGPYDQEEEARQAVKQIQERTGIIAEAMLSATALQAGMALPGPEPTQPETPSEGDPAQPGTPLFKPGEFVVLAGSFTLAATARSVHSRLAALGLTVHGRESTVEGQQQFHVLVGPFANKALAARSVAEIQSRTGILAEALPVH